MRNNLPYLTWISIFLLFVFSLSCQRKKGDELIPNGSNTIPEDSYFIRFKFDGKLVGIIESQDRNTTVDGEINQVSSGIYNSALGGFKDEKDVKRNVLSILFSDSTAVTTGQTYTPRYGETAVGEKKLTLLFLTYRDDRGVEYTSSLTYHTGLVTDTKIRLSGLTEQYIKGTFSSTVYSANPNGSQNSSDKHLITEGEFYIRRIF